LHFYKQLKTRMLLNLNSRKFVRLPPPPPYLNTLTVYTRHHPGCPKKDDSTYCRCRCPKWLDGTSPGCKNQFRVSATNQILRAGRATALDFSRTGPNPNDFFWPSNGLPKTYVANWQRAYRRLFAVASLHKPDGTPKRAHCHMFRDTFAVEMLLAGVPIDQVSILLGHASLRVTKKHDSPWVRAR
jgi:hypothetical protein